MDLDKLTLRDKGVCNKGVTEPDGNSIADATEAPGMPAIRALCFVLKVTLSS
jgi:hypothetical protein